jgi:hypothetical protein
MPFGEYRGRSVESLPRDYLAGLLRSGLRLSARLRKEVEITLAPDCGCLGPPWWHIQRACGTGPLWEQAGTTANEEGR